MTIAVSLIYTAHYIRLTKWLGFENDGTTLDDTPSPKTYELTVAGVTRRLPILEVAPGQRIASFVMLGDTELTAGCGRLLADRLEAWNLDCILVPEGRALPLAQVIAFHLSRPERFLPYVVVRKGIKAYMRSPLVQHTTTVTTAGEQALVLDGVDAARLRGRRVCVLDDLISTGGTIRAVAEIGRMAGAQLCCVAAVLLEGADTVADPQAKTGGLPAVWLGTLPTF